MARFTGSIYKKARRLSFSLLETGQELKKRNYAPGQHGVTRRAKLSDYGNQLREKQRIRFMYGVSERQFYNTYLKAVKKDGVTGTNLLELLESRLDNLVYRMNLSRTRQGARQLVNHGHVLVDGNKVDIPSYIVKPGQTISIKEKSKKNPHIQEALEASVSTLGFVEINKETKVGKYLRLPQRNELNQDINEALVVEFYSR